MDVRKFPGAGIEQFNLCVMRPLIVDWFAAARLPETNEDQYGREACDQQPARTAVRVEQPFPEIRSTVYGVHREIVFWQPSLHGLILGDCDHCPTGSASGMEGTPE
jgi:hypothetical protein